jgi:predicted nucleic acid-binding protein
MTDLVFVDANVLVYARDPRNKAKQAAAAEWLASLWRSRLGRLSVHVLSEYYVTATRKLNPSVPGEDVWEDVKAFCAWRPQPSDETLLDRAREIEKRYRLSWWDSMIVAAAQLQDCALLLTEDLQDGATFGNVVVRSPFTLTIDEPRPSYEVSYALPLHRPRGRPRKHAPLLREA